MSVLAGLFAQAEAGQPQPSDGTYRFEVVLDPSETQVICFDELVEQQRQSASMMLDASGASSKASEPDSDKGSCYDSDDSFLDDDELVAELEPSNMKSTIGGFFINTGSMDAEEDPEYGKQGDYHESGGGNGGGGGGGGGKKKKKKKANKKEKRTALDQGAGDSHKRQKTDQATAEAFAPLAGSAPVPGPAAVAPAAVSSAVAGSVAPATTADSQPSPRGAPGRVIDGGKPKKKKGPPLPKIHDGIAARIEDLRRVVDSRDSESDGARTVYPSFTLLSIDNLLQWF
jgi:hypothetical protein